MQKRSRRKKHRSKSSSSTRIYVCALNHPKWTQLFHLKALITLEWFASEIVMSVKIDRMLWLHLHSCAFRTDHIHISLSLSHPEHRERQFTFEFHFLFIFSWIVFCLVHVMFVVRCSLSFCRHLYTMANIRMLGKSNLKHWKNVIAFIISNNQICNMCDKTKDFMHFNCNYCCQLPNRL